MSVGCGVVCQEEEGMDMLGHGYSGSNPEPPLAVTSLSEVLHERLPGNRYIQKPGHFPGFTGFRVKRPVPKNLDG
jgi:hypothetical protein